MVSRHHERLTKLEVRVKPRSQRVFVCFDDDIQTFKASNAIGLHDHFVQLTFIANGAPAVPTNSRGPFNA
jgi:hypothetical protein